MSETVMDGKVTSDLEMAAATAERPPSLAEGGTPVPGSALSAEELEQLTADIVAALKTVYDPEIPADIYELGLIYKIDIADDHGTLWELKFDAADGTLIKSEKER